MRRCTALQKGSARYGQSWRTISHLNCLYSTGSSHDNASRSHPDGSSLQKEERQAFKINSENKTIETTAGDLPLSPLMDPAYWEAKQRHKLPKPRRSKPLNSVERQLRANAFALALATPFRRDALTRNRLPSFFLQDFSLVGHPETGDPWWVPRGLALRQPPAEADGEEEATEAEGSQSIAEDFEAAQLEDEIDEKSISELTSTEGTRPATSAVKEQKGREPSGRSIYVLARKDVIASFTEKGSGLTNFHMRMSAETGPRGKPVASRTVWREDMDTFMLSLMRQDIVDDLNYLSRLCEQNERYYVVRCYGWDDVQFKHKGAVLWFGEPSDEASTGRGRDSSGTRELQPGLLATFDVQGKTSLGDTASMTLLVHNLPLLLGEDLASQVRTEASVFREGSIFMLAGRRTKELQMKLWRLQGYMSDHRNVEADG